MLAGAACVSDSQLPSDYIAVRVEVQWTDLDPAGIVFYPRYYAWMDISSHVLCREMGIPPEDMVPPTLLGFPVVATHAQYSAPGNFGDTLEVRTWVTRIGRTSLGVRHEIWRMAESGDTLLVRGGEERVFVGRNEHGALAPRELTPAMREVLARYLDPAPKA